MNMPVNELKEYLSMIIDTENNLLLQEKAIEGIEKKQSLLMIEKKIVEPKYQQPKSRFLIALAGGTFIAVIAYIIGFFLIGIIFGHNWDVADALNMILKIACVGIAIVTAILEVRKDKEAAKTAEEKYRQDMVAYEAALNADKERVSKEAVKHMLLDTDIISMKMKLLGTRNVLNELYSADIIYPKYRNLAMVASIFEYLDSGRCETLEGHDGAYNILEAEMRLDKIIVKLDNIIDKLDNIMMNQRTLYNALIQTYENTEKLVKSIDDIADRIAFQNDKLSSIDIDKLREAGEFAAYSAERAEKELHYMNWMKHLSGDYKYSRTLSLPNDIY